MTTEQKFQVGDIVEAWGCRGEVIEFFGVGKYPVKVRIKDNLGVTYSFTNEGLYNEWHKEPSLKLISRAKKNCTGVESKDNPMVRVLQEVAVERARQETKWGRQDHSPKEWLMILGEEVGEANKAALETHFGYKNASPNYSEYRKELIQVAAVAVSMIESLDRNEGLVTK